MKKSLLIIFVLLISSSLFADDFVTQFIDTYVEEKRPVNNVNIGKTMLKKMAEDVEDAELKTLLKELNHIRMVITENRKDAKYYFKKANELVDKEFSDYEKMLSVDERKSKVEVLFKEIDKDNQNIILIALDNDRKLTIISVSGKVDFNSISKLSDLLNEEIFSSGTNNEHNRER
ncbi:MAG TPA: hypothetical protein DDZ96_07775 [Porphyromonadaceae bacterium]|jgi:hypothetical protein|uniref:DUF4252 domain-containing protein n=1 Tax=Limibacterium fermenti TaxID=3229863 RepID=UPI000E7EFBEC|nr:hypothetical protein [Porphyromonadaceae bacterium]HBK32531.1 hypothetical protein [Porphyromonadaceae bacterium]HBL33702.1 hypothetical protein [Porphyromonadaceae bacterium]HBX18983.1 hypothetical protein [Porphyromonadaceae bacterium]HBX46885.1 hypothetical protein [Porphyromonadaceae bacterium]